MNAHAAARAATTQTQPPTAHRVTLVTRPVPQPYRVLLTGGPVAPGGELVTVLDEADLDDLVVVRSAHGDGFWCRTCEQIPGMPGSAELSSTSTRTRGSSPLAASTAQEPARRRFARPSPQWAQLRRSGRLSRTWWTVVFHIQSTRGVAAVGGSFVKVIIG